MVDALEPSRSHANVTPVQGESPGLTKTAIWLREVFSRNWTNEWLNACPAGPIEDREEDCRVFKDIGTQISLAPAASDDFWAIYMEEELVTFADKKIGMHDERHFRAKCNSFGCILVFADEWSKGNSTLWTIRSDVEGQAWVREFQKVLYRACYGCGDIQSHIFVMPRRQIESTTAQ